MDNAADRTSGEDVSTQGLTQEQFREKLAQLIVNWPLYRTFEFTGDVRQQKLNFSPPRYELGLPKALMMECTRCVHRQPWDLKVPPDGKADLGLCLIRYSCRACGLVKHYCLFSECKQTGGFVIKIGQYPALELEPPPLVAAGMEKSDILLYRHALTCRHSNFGIAAVAYLRRIVENRTNFLIDLVAARRQQEEDDPTSLLLQRVDEVKRDKRFSAKIEFAADLLPESIRVGGQNPITLLHDLTSEALHGLSDEESVDVFDRCQLAFEHVVKRLKQDQDEDRDFKDALKKLTDRATKKKPTTK